MENNLLQIVKRVNYYIDAFKNSAGITEFTELEILHTISDELLEDIGDLNNENVRKILVNMFLAGRFFPENEIVGVKSIKENPNIAWIINMLEGDLGLQKYKVDDEPLAGMSGITQRQMAQHLNKKQVEQIDKKIIELEYAIKILKDNL